MKPITKINSVDGIVRLGEVYLPICGKFDPVNSRDLYGLVPIAALVSGLGGRTIMFETAGIDSAAYGVSNWTEEGMKILSKKGKEIILPNERIMQMFSEFPNDKSAISTSLPLSIYSRTAKYAASKFKMKNTIKLPGRLLDLEKWPVAALRSWAMYSLGLPESKVPISMNDKRRAIVEMIQANASEHLSEKLRDKINKLKKSAKRTEENDYTYTIDVSEIGEWDVLSDSETHFETIGMSPNDNSLPDQEINFETIGVSPNNDSR